MVFESLAAYTVSESVQVFGDDGGPPRAIGGFKTATSGSQIAFSGNGDALVTQLPGTPSPPLRIVSIVDGRELFRPGADVLGFTPNFVGT